MAGKYKRTVVGSIIKSKDPAKPNYIKFNLRDGGTLTVKDGDTLSAETKKYQLASAEAAAAEGKITDEVVEKIRARLDKQPDFVIAELVHVTRS